ITAGALLAGCFSGTTLDQARCPDGGTRLTYASFGEEFFGRWCQGCHGSAAADRHGATAVTFDTLDQIRRARERIFLRAAADNDSMPPGPDDPPAAVRQQPPEWLAGGAAD